MSQIPNTSMSTLRANLNAAMLLLDGIHVVEGRLTLLTETPVTTTGQTAKTTVYFTPYKGNRISLYTSGVWTIYALTEISTSVPANASTPFDLFVYDNAGTLTLEATAWTNATTRATALVLQDGVYVKSGAVARRYLGTGCTTGTSGQCEDSFANRFLWNYYNRVARPIGIVETTNTWVYTTATIRQANANVNNQLNFVIGVSEDMVEADASCSMTNTTATIPAYTLIGLDATNAMVSGALSYAGSAPASQVGNSACRWKGFPGIGKHYLSWLEYSVATGTCTWNGDAGIPSLIQSGIHGFVLG